MKSSRHHPQTRGHHSRQDYHRHSVEYKKTLVDVMLESNLETSWDISEIKGLPLITCAPSGRSGSSLLGRGGGEV